MVDLVAGNASKVCLFGVSQFLDAFCGFFRPSVDYVVVGGNSDFAPINSIIVATLNADPAAHFVKCKANALP